MTDELTRTGFLESNESRRDFLKKGAVAGGIVWAAPVLTTLASPAGAASAPGTCVCTGSATALTATGLVNATLGSATSCVLNVDATVAVAGTTVIDNTLCGSFNSSTCTASSSVDSTTITTSAGTITVGLLQTSATMTSACANTGTFSLANASVTFTPLVGLATTVNVNTGCNSTSVTITGVATIAANKRTCGADGTFTVTGLEITLLGTLQVIDIAVSSVKQSCCGQCSNECA